MLLKNRWRFYMPLWNLGFENGFPGAHEKSLCESKSCPSPKMYARDLHNSPKTLEMSKRARVRIRTSAEASPYAIDLLCPCRISVCLVLGQLPDNVSRGIQERSRAVSGFFFSTMGHPPPLRPSAADAPMYLLRITNAHLFNISVVISKPIRKIQLGLTYT